MALKCGLKMVKRAIWIPNTTLLSTKAVTKDAVVADLAASCWSVADLHIFMNFIRNWEQRWTYMLGGGRQDV
jgi:hypothetical protein